MPSSRTHSTPGQTGIQYSPESATGSSRREEGEQLTPFWRRRTELSVQNRSLLWGSRVVIPPQGQAKVLELLHESQPGASRMKSFARSYVWWPSMDETIKESCTQCQELQKAPAKAPLHPWEWPERPWSWLHANYAVLFLGKMFLVMVVAHSKWLEVHEVSAATSQGNIDKISYSATHGLPEVLVTDNGSVFTSLVLDHTTHDYRSSSSRTANGETVEIHVGSHSS